MYDPLIDKAINLREQLHIISDLTEQQQESLRLSDKQVMLSLEKACKTCVEMGEYFLQQQNWNGSQSTYHIFQRLVEENVIEPDLSKRMLSLISFGKLIGQASRIKGKNCLVRLNKRQLEDMHVFTQNLLLS